MGYRLHMLVVDMLIRDVSYEVLAAVDSRASRLGLSQK